MDPAPPGWYRDPRRPGGRRYWDGRAWVNVDSVVDGSPDPGPVATGPRLISQRRGDAEPPDVRDALPEVTDEVDRDLPAD
jgi:hypothetical protein